MFMALSETSDDKLFKGDGGRLFEIIQQREIDSAVRRVRLGLGSDWEAFRDDEGLLASAFKAAWEDAERDEWGTFRFSSMTEQEVSAILAVEKAVATKKKSRTQACAEILDLLRKTVGRE